MGVGPVAFVLITLLIGWHQENFTAVFLQRLPSEDEFITIAYSLSGLKLTREELQEDYEHLSSQQCHCCKNSKALVGMFDN